jgi:ABC-type antimicrobial peptide transport system permease subunit
VLALVVAALGVFGVLAFQMARRTSEIGIRMALGADRRLMLWLVLREVAIMVALGVGLGGAAAAAVTGVARSLLFGLSPTDPRAFATAAATLGAAALFAGWLPARRASRVDPLTALRHE